MGDFQIVNGDAAHPVPVVLVSSSDGITGVTGLSSATILAGSFVSKNGAAEAAAAGSYSVVGGGTYAYTPTAGEVNTNGGWRLSIRGVAGVQPTDVICQVVPYNIYSSSFGADPWATAVPASYGTGTAGNILGNTSTASAVASAVATAVLVTPANKLATDASGEVNLNLAQAIPNAPTQGTVGDALLASEADGVGKWTLVGTTLTLFRHDGVTVVRTFNLDSSTAPTQRV